MARIFVIPVGVDSADGFTPLPSQPYQSGGGFHIVGTPLPTTSLFMVGATTPGLAGTFLEEMPGSPRIERAEQCTCDHTLKLDKTSALTYCLSLARGTIVSDTGANIWRVLSCDYTRDSDLYATLHYVMEALSFDSPPDDFELNDVSLDLNIIKHPRYWRWLSPYASDTNPVALGTLAQSSIAEIKEALIRVVQNYIESPFYPSINATTNYIQSNILDDIKSGNFKVAVTNTSFDPGQDAVEPVVWDGNNDDQPDESVNCRYYLVPCAYAYQNESPNGQIHMAIAAATELISKLWRQEDTPYIPAYEVVWTQRFFQPIYLNPGAYLEDPRDVVPGYFMGAPSPNFANINQIPRGNQGAIGPVTDVGNADTVPAYGVYSGSILDHLVQINPQLYSSNGTASGFLTVSSLRTSDSYRYERTWFAVTHKWKVACVGKWDADLYLGYGQSAPQVADDFNQNPIGPADI